MESLIKDENYVIIQGWMLNRLGLKNNELNIYAVIYGFSQTDDTEYSGSLQYLADWCNCTKQGVMKCLHSLLEKGYIFKTETIKNKLKFCSYRVNLSLLNKVTTSKQSLTGSKQSLIGGVKQSLTNNINLDIKDNNINNKGFSGLIEQNFESEKVQNALKVWLDHKKQKRQSYTEIGFKKLISKIKKDIDAHGEQYVLDAIDYSLEQNYAGIYPKPTTAKAQPKKEYIRHNYSAEVLQEQETSIEEF